MDIWTWTTPKGTVLHLMDLKGKKYLPVAQRLIWFREEHPKAQIKTEYMVFEPTEATCRASIIDEQGVTLATAHKTETKTSFKFGHAEKAETGAVGRALAFIGYGTQFCADELDEGESVVDAPIEGQSSQDKGQNEQKRPMESYPKVIAPPQAPHRPSISSGRSGGPGAYVLTMGQTKGATLDEVGPQRADALLQWLKNKAPATVRGSAKGKAEMMAIELYLKLKGNGKPKAVVEEPEFTDSWPDEKDAPHEEQLPF